MKIPNQVISESLKNKAFIEKTITAIAIGCKNASDGKQKDYESWLLYNEQFNEGEFDYLRKVGKFVLPAKFRWIGVQRPRINLLASQESKRPWVYTLRVGDLDSKKEKIVNKSRFVISQIKNKIETNKVDLQRQLIGMQGQLQQLEQMLQQEPQNEQEQQQMQEIAQKLPEIKLIMETQMKRIHDEVLYTEKDIEELDIHLRMTWQDQKEMYAEILADKMKYKLRLKEKKIEGLIASCVTGKANYYVDYIEGKALPVFEVIDDVKVYFPKVSNVDFIQDGPWVAIEEGYTIDKVVGMFGSELTKEEIEILEDNMTYDFYDGTETAETKKTASISGIKSYEGSESSYNMVRCWKVFYKSPRKVYIKASLNPYKEGAYFRHIIEEKELKSIKEDKGDKLVVRYVTDIYEGIYVEKLKKVFKSGKKKYCRTYLDDYTKRDLPIYGETFARLSKRPYSLIKATEELQKLINILHYHRELLLALSGTKGTVIDLSQVPSGMSTEEHQYHKKKGSLYIQTVSKGGRKINSSFNQWTQYDETLSPAIQYIDNMINSTDQMIGYLMGIGPQRMGQVVTGDQVGKTEMSIQQNALVTEILFYNHDQIFGKAFEAALNLATKYCLHDGGIISRDTTTQGEQHIIVPKDMFKNVEFDMYVENSTEEESSLMQLKQMAVNKHMQGQLPFSNIVSLYRLKSLKELEKKYEYFEEKAMEAAQAAQSGQIQAQGQAEQQKIQIEQEYKAAIEKQKSELQAMSLELEKQKFEFEQKKFGVEMEMQDKEMRTKMATEIYKVDKDHEVEMSYLSEQNRQSQMDEQLREIQLKLDTFFKKAELSMANTKQAYDAFNAGSKIKVEDRKVRLAAKEKIKD